MISQERIKLGYDLSNGHAYSLRDATPHLKGNQFNPEKEYFEFLLKDVVTSDGIKPHYDAHDDLKRAGHNLDWSFSAKGPENFFKTTPEEEAARVDSWYGSRLREIAMEEAAFRQRLDSARKSGAIDESDYMGARMDLEFTTSPFKRAKQEAFEKYHKERKF